MANESRSERYLDSMINTLEKTGKVVDTPEPMSRIEEQLKRIDEDLKNGGGGGGGSVTVDTELSEISANPIANSAVTKAINEVKTDVNMINSGFLNDINDVESSWEQGRVGVNGIYLNYTESTRNCRSKIIGLNANEKYEIEVPESLKLLLLKTNADGSRGAFSDIIWQTGKLAYTTFSDYPSVIFCLMKSNNGILTPEECSGVKITRGSSTKIATNDDIAKIKPIGLEEIALYRADTKATEGHIVNAVSYDYGTIIACRSDGKVDKINVNGGVETLLSLDGENFDWRGLFMDSNGNVFASPHASNGSMQMSDRGIYKFVRNGTSMTKVLSLYDPESAYTPATEENDDTIWTFCEDENGILYAGVYAHTKHRNPTVYRSEDGGDTWKPLVKFSAGNHIHAIVYSRWQKAVYCAVGEVNTIWKYTTADGWRNLNVKLTVKGSSLLPTENGLLIGSDGAYNCDIDILENDDTTHHKLYRGFANTIFALRESDKTGYIYAFTKIDSSVSSQNYYPPLSAFAKSNPIDIWAGIKTWKDSISNDIWQAWRNYHDSIADRHPNDAIIPTHYSILVSRDRGMTWEVFKSFGVSSFVKAYGFWTTGYFKNGECLTGVYNDNGYDNPLVISENSHTYTEGGCNFDGEIFIKTNSTTIAPSIR